MMVAAITFLLCSLVAASAAALYYPRPYQQVEIQSHFTAPSRGCVEIGHHNGGVHYRSYMCDGDRGSCVFSFNPTCPQQSLFHRANADHLVNVRGRQHTFRYYNQIGGVCYLALVPPCCDSSPTRASTVDQEIRQLAMEEEEHCTCVNLPDGERLCDPVNCESAERQVINPQQNQENQVFNLQERA